MKVLVAGDFCDRYRVSDSIKNRKFDTLFDALLHITKSCDYNILNFEFPIVNNEEHPIPKSGPNLKGQKDAVNAIKYAGFNVCTLANNHILDQGEQCCLDTIAEIEKCGILTVGAGRNIEEASHVLYLEKGGEKLAIVNCCEHEFSIATEKSAGANPLNIIRQYHSIKEAREKSDFVLVIVHGGHEHYQLPSPRMQETYRFFIEAGADAVINHHQHCFSGYEIYNNKPIFYGLGNLLFDEPRNRNCPWNEGYMVVLSFRKDKTITFNIHPYKQCNDVPSIELLPADDKGFEDKINKLNGIIGNESLLFKEHQEWMERTHREYELLFQPMRSRITDALFRRHLLPSILLKSRKLLLYNFMSCESHVERLIQMVRRGW